MQWLVALLRRRRLIVAAGFILLILLIVVAGSWFGLSPTTRMFGVMLVLFLWVLLLMYERMQAYRGAARLEQSIKAQAEDQLLAIRPEKRKEIEEFKQQLADAIDALKKSRLGRGRSGKAALYALPWYMFIGPPAAGKTTAIMNSGLEFPFGADRIRGVGGTRNCDWFFSNSAILLDTAGRYTTEEEDTEEWYAFLDMLKKHRRRKPINGVIVGVSIADLASANIEELEWHATNIRRRIDELIQRLGVRFPVYLVFTKCDLLQGFVDFFEDLNRRGREQVWGCTLTREQQEDPNPRDVFEAEFQALLETLMDMRLTRLSVRMKRENRLRAYVFPLELQAAGANLAHFVGKVFQPNPYQESPVFRGFYFTSGTQEGVPIDRVIQSMARQFDLPPEVIEQFDPEMETKSYFIHDLFTDVIIADQNMAERTSRAAMQSRLMRMGAMAGSGVLLAGFILAVSQAFIRSKLELRAVASAARQMENVRWDSGASLSKNFLRLERLRERIVDLEGSGRASSLLRLGMARGGWVAKPARRLYHRKAGAFIKSHLYGELARRMRAFTGGADFPREQMYNHLKAYLLMGLESVRLDTAGQNFLRRELLSVLDDRFLQYMDPEEMQELRPLIERQVQFYVQSLAEGEIDAFDNDKRLVRQVRSLIFEPPSIRTVYARLRREAEGRLEPFTLESAVAGRSLELFRPPPQVPGLFTRAGWESYMKDAIDAESEDPGKEDWVLGTGRQRLPPEMRDPATMARSLRSLYFADYVDAWRNFLRGLRYEPFGDIDETSDRLRLISDPLESPLVLLLSRVSEETTLESRLAGGIREKAGGLVGRVGRKIGLGDDQIPSAEEYLVPRHPVDRQFAALHSLMTPTADGGAGVAGPLGSALNQFKAVRDEIEAIRSEPERAKEYAARVLRDRAGGLPEALRTVRSALAGMDRITREVLFEQPIREAWAAILRQAQQDLNELWRMRVYRPFRNTLANDYPFNPRGRDASIVDVERFFQPGTGTIWTFVEDELRPFIRRDSWKPQLWEGRGIQLSSATVAALKKAQAIAQGLFYRGALQVDFRLQPELPTPLTISGPTPIVDQVCLTIDGVQDCYRMGRPRWIDFTWPGRTGPPGANLEILTRGGSSSEPKRFDGDWGWFRLLGKARIQRESSTSYRLQWLFTREDRYHVLVKYRLQASSAYNPFGRFKTFFDFRCPDRLD
jgi:type VI secretion system protein ImpL